MKIILSKYGDFLENKDAHEEDLLSNSWIGNHSCGTANTGKLNLSNFSPNSRVIVCSHYHTTYIIPKNIQTFGDLQNFFKRRLQ
jgi:hypothetical protein